MDLPIFGIILIVILLALVVAQDDLFEAFTEPMTNTEAIQGVASIYNDEDMSVGNLTTTRSLTNKGPTTLEGTTTLTGSTNFKGGTGGTGGTHFPYSNGLNYIRGHTTLNGNLSVSGDLTGKTVNEFNSKIDSLNKEKANTSGFRCYDRTKGWTSRGNGNTEYLDRQSVYCNSNEFMQGFKLDRSGDSIRYKYRCCRLNS